MARSKKRRRRDRQPHSEVSGLIIIAFAILAAASLLPFDTGRIGAFLGILQRNIAGDYALFVPFTLMLWGLRTLLFPRSELFGQRALGTVIIIASLLTAVHIQVAPDFTRATLWSLSAEGGGVIGAVGAIALLEAFGLAGSMVVLVSAAFIGFYLVINISLKQMVIGIGGWLTRFGETLAQVLAAANGAIKAVVARRPQVSQDKPVVIDYQGEGDEGGGEPAKPVLEPQPPPPLPQPEPVTVPLETAGEQEEVNESYQLPPLNLLQKTIRLKDPQGRKELVSQADILEETLASFGIQAKVINVHRGPTITRFEIQPAAGVKVSKIVNLADDLALSLAATGVRIEAPIPGKSAVGLEVANKAKATVYLREVLETEAFLNSPSILSIALGKDIAGEPVVADLTEIPHLLIAGATGSGKSVCLNAIITSLLYKAKPHELKLLLIDPKVVELNVYNGLPHLLCPVVTDPRQAAQGLKNIVKEMEQRYQLFAQKGARDIQRYNELAAQQGEKKLPYIIVIIDELADLMMTAAVEVEDTICRIAQKSRAAGIHLIVATQRPSVDVITGVIKANITTRIAFAVSSQADSRTILDMGGAEKLLGRGDMLWLPVGAAKPRRVQSAYISEEEVEKVVAHVLGQAMPHQFTDFLAPRDDEETSLEEADELLPEAARLVIESGQASISLLQRRLRIGYTRAARLIDDMERLGIVGGFEGSKARKILVTPVQLEEILREFSSN